MFLGLAETIVGELSWRYLGIVQGLFNLLYFVILWLHSSATPTNKLNTKVLNYLKLTKSSESSFCADNIIIANQLTGKIGQAWPLKYD